jgi:hypothetical protein
MPSTNMSPIDGKTLTRMCRCDQDSGIRCMQSSLPLQLVELVERWR